MLIHINSLSLFVQTITKHKNRKEFLKAIDSLEQSPIVKMNKIIKAQMSVSLDLVFQSVFFFFFLKFTLQ